MPRKVMVGYNAYMVAEATGHSFGSNGYLADEATYSQRGQTRWAAVNRPYLGEAESAIRHNPVPGSPRL